MCSCNWLPNRTPWEPLGKFVKGNAQFNRGPFLTFLLSVEIKYTLNYTLVN